MNKKELETLQKMCDDGTKLCANCEYGLEPRFGFVANGGKLTVWCEHTQTYWFFEETCSRWNKPTNRTLNAIKDEIIYKSRP